ncbi:cyclic nucleotide-binding domain-containing protein [Hymenobacter sp. HMF4947]|uniref:Cyclic nucleotide-binding domain-containing protein n=1 Tax=Hymenobacter ginkgonis TaxID=2682976 RepID=A0A7K1TA11_9BACT|nr:Crp/Fnr family transcriptional regulator [Hymenobacter ginkgonis]MVN75235.1 cyclic nucleotide-binding domain-containing protein [Hymenobacter ginkgonis]
MYAPLLAHIARYVALTPEEATLLVSYLRTQTVARKDFLLREGQVCPASYFVLRGCLRTYFISDKGTEQIIQFSIENWWVSDYASLATHMPSQYTIQAIELVEVVVFDKHVQEEVFDHIPKLERYFRLVFQRVAAAAMFRGKFLFGMSGEARYHYFNEALPGFVQRVPQYMLASYLGFTPEFLSKIRAR